MLLLSSRIHCHGQFDDRPIERFVIVGVMVLRLLVTGSTIFVEGYSLGNQP